MKHETWHSEAQNTKLHGTAQQEHHYFLDVISEIDTLIESYFKNSAAHPTG